MLYHLLMAKSLSGGSGGGGGDENILVVYGDSSSGFLYKDAVHSSLFTMNDFLGIVYSGDYPLRIYVSVGHADGEAIYPASYSITQPEEIGEEPFATIWYRDEYNNADATATAEGRGSSEAHAFALSYKYEESRQFYIEDNGDGTFSTNLTVDLLDDYFAHLDTVVAVWMDAVNGYSAYVRPDVFINESIGKVSIISKFPTDANLTSYRSFAIDVDMTSDPPTLDVREIL